MPVKTLFDGAKGTLPGSQGWLAFGQDPDGAASQTLKTGFSEQENYTQLVTKLTGRAGYSNYKATFAAYINSGFPSLVREDGFNLKFRLKLNAEDHGTSSSRAGFSTTLLSSARLGVELGFWSNEIWAQRGGSLSSGTLFTKGESSGTFSTQSWRTYDLLILEGQYYLSSAGKILLLGVLKDYSAFPYAQVRLSDGSSLPYNPYAQANYFFAGDNTSSASSDVSIGLFAIASADQLGLVGQNNVFSGTSGEDLLNGKDGHDTLTGGDGDDVLIGGAGHDRLDGNGGADRLIGGGGDDLVLGGTGLDWLHGGAGNDTLNGGVDADRFLFDSRAAFSASMLGVDVLQDFVPGPAGDRIVLSKTTFAALSDASKVGSTLSSAEFSVVTSDTSAAGSTARIVFNSGNGKLFYNPNGSSSGFGTGAQFALLSPPSGSTTFAPIAASDFEIIA